MNQPIVFYSSILKIEITTFVVRYVTETRPERERLKKEKEEKTLEHLRRVVEVQNIFFRDGF